MILIDNRQNKMEVDEYFEEKIINVIEYALRAEEVKIDYEVSVIFVDNEKIKEINKEFRQIDRETDVLSFPMLEYPSGMVYKDVYRENSFNISDMDGSNLVLGDIVLSLEKAEEQSKEYGHSFVREACYLTVHSVLHLLGYDHMNEDEKALMRKREEDILLSMNITR